MKITVWGGHYENMPVDAIEGETTVGSKVAMFGCREKDALETIGKIEVGEGLPHPMIGGEWSKVASETGRSYLIAGFGESNIDEMLNLLYRKRDRESFLEMGIGNLNDQIANGTALASLLEGDLEYRIFYRRSTDYSGVLGSEKPTVVASVFYGVWPK